MHQPVEEPKVKMVFVYGTLKRGKNNNHVMMRANGRFVGNHETAPVYRMYRLGGFPGVVEDGYSSIKGEVFEVDTLEPLDRLESYPSFYDRKLIDTEYGPAWMYILGKNHRAISHLPIVVSGTWE